MKSRMDVESINLILLFSGDYHRKNERHVDYVM